MDNKIDRFTPSSRYIMSLSEKEAERLQHTTIGTPHILLAMIRSEYGVAGHVLRELGLELEHVRKAVGLSTLEEVPKNLFSQVLNRLFNVKSSASQSSSKQIDLSPQVKQLLELAVHKARRMGDQYIGTEHLLLGMMQHKGCKALVILDLFGVSTRAIRNETTKLLSERPDQTNLADQPPLPNKMDRFTEKSKHVLYFAQEEAKRLQHNSIDTQHLLVGLIRENDSIASRVLREMNATVDRIIELSPQLSNDADDKPLELAPDTKKILELAVDEARLMEHTFIGTEHLLLGLIRHEKSVAFDILSQLDISPEDIRLQINRYIR